MADPTLPLLFDLDGTLVDSLPDIAASVNHVRERFTLPPLASTAVRDLLGDGLPVLLRRALKEAGEAAQPAALQAYREHHRAQCTVFVQPFDGVREHLARWHGAGRPMAVVTNKEVAFATRILEHTGLARFLPVVIGGDTMPEKKPAPGPLRAALRALGVGDGRGMMVGDGLQDLRAGKAAGLRTAAALFGYRSATVLRAEGADEYWVRFGVPEGTS
jgi:phosphoglycolate phosphatase